MDPAQPLPEIDRPLVESFDLKPGRETEIPPGPCGKVRLRIVKRGRKYKAEVVKGGKVSHLKEAK